MHTTRRGCRLAWSRLVASGVIDESSNLSSPTTNFWTVSGSETGVFTLSLQIRKNKVQNAKRPKEAGTGRFSFNFASNGGYIEILFFFYLCFHSFFPLFLVWFGFFSLSGLFLVLLFIFSYPPTLSKYHATLIHVALVAKKVNTNLQKIIH